MPKGVTEVHIPAGSHTITHHVTIIGSDQYYFRPVTSSFDTEAGRTYLVRFTRRGHKPLYGLEYEGWETEQSSLLPDEVKIANPVFGH